MTILSGVGSFFASALVSFVLFLGALFGMHYAAATQAPLVGAVVPVTTSFYDDSLQSGITATQTSFTLVSGVDASGKALSGTYGFVIDQGTAAQEIVYCTNVSGTSVSGCTRGIDLTTGTTSDPSLEQVHNRGASVQITTAPVVNIIANILRGVESISNHLFYTTGYHPCNGSSPSTTICDKNYIDTALISGSVPGSNSVPGIFLTATGAQAASSTSSGTYNLTSYLRVLPSSIATDTPNTATAASKVLLSDLTGHLKQAWLNLTQLFNFTGGIESNASSTLNDLHVNGRLVGTPTFGGTGVDGALSISSGTTTIAIGSKSVVEKDYTSISITGTGALAFSTGGATSTAGVTVILRSQGACTFTSSSKTMINLQWLGGGVGDAQAGSSFGGGGGAGAGGAGGSSGGSSSGPGFPTGFHGFASSNTLWDLSTGGASGIATPALATTSRMVSPGGNGAAGQASFDGGTGGAAGTAGLGGGSLYIECGGAYDFTTGGFNANGSNGGNGGNGGSNGGSGGGGGAGAGGSILVLYNSLTADSGTYSLTGGTGGSAGSPNGTGHAGAGGANAPSGTHLEAKNTAFY